MNPDPNLIRVALVEDRRATRQGIASLIRASEGLVCVAACSSGEKALELLPSLQPAIILMDIGLPGKSGIECIRELKLKLPAASIMMLTVFEDPEKIFQALSAGAKGYLIKKTSPSELLKAIRELHEGGAPMSSQIARRVVDAFEKRPPKALTAARLSPREREVLDLLAQGLLYKEIAARLDMGIGTLRGHISSIYEKLHVHNRTEALLKVL
jgi:DNA-binding NarL/FixJ family response regulator